MVDKRSYFRIRHKALNIGLVLRREIVFGWLRYLAEGSYEL